MKWFLGDTSQAIKTAISGKKLFIVFIKGENEESAQMEEQLNNAETTKICSDENCVAINITSDSEAGQQFASIYPILCVPSTYLINNDGIPSDIIPALVTDEEFSTRIKKGMENFLVSQPAQTEPPVANEVSPSSNTIDEVKSQVSMDTSNDNTVVDDSESAKERAEKLLEKSRVKKDEKEKEQQKEQERQRREEGRELSQAKRDLAERQARQLADEIAERRAEDKAAREKVKKQIQQDREDKLARFEADKKSRQQEKEKNAKEKEEAMLSAKPKVNSNVSRLQFRLPNGSTSSKQFPADAKFVVVVDHVTKELVTDCSNLRFTTSFPKREFTSEDHSKSLRDLGLVPNASIIVSPGKKQSSSSTSLNPFNIIMLVLSPFIAIFNWILSLFTGGGNSSPPTQSNLPSQSNPSDNTADQRSANVRRRNLDSRAGPNIRRLYDDKPDNDDNATWNGNSTQQM